MRSSSSSTSSTRTRASRNPKDAPVMGLPRIRYYTPVIATILATLLVILVIGILTLLALGKMLSSFNPSVAGGSDGSTVQAGFCGVLTIIGAISTVYFIFALVKGLRDIASPVYYARGTMLDKRILGGRKTGTWMGVGVRYLGSDLESAQVITDDQRAAFPDRSKIVQPRFSQQRPETPARTKRTTSYLPEDRIASTKVIASKEPVDPSVPRIVFRVDQASFEALEPGEEVLIAHSQHLQHIYFVAHIKGGEWESYRNRLLI